MKSKARASLVFSLLVPSLAIDSYVMMANAAVNRPPSVSAQTTQSTNPTPGVPAQTLSDAYLAALKRSETVDIQKELFVQTVEGTTQAKEAFLPTISGNASFAHLQTPTSSQNPMFLADQRTAKVTGDLPLFRGLKEYAGLRQRKYQQEAQLYNFKAAAKQLFYDLSTAYYNVLALQGDAKNYEEEIQINQKRLVELKRFLRIGRSRSTDLLTFESNISSLEAQLEATRGQLETAKDVLAFLTGWNRDTPLLDNEKEITFGTVNDSLKSIEQRPDVVAALKNAKSAVEGIPIARSGHFPSVDLIADNYFERPGLPDGGPDWDVQLVLSIPIYEGGIINSQVRQAQSVANQNELSLSLARRTAEEEIRTFNNSYVSDQKQIVKLDETFGWAKKSYEAELHDYRNGLVTNLDVLQAITTYQDAQRNLDHMRVQAKLDSVKLQAATAKRAEIDVTANIEK